MTVHTIIAKRPIGKVKSERMGIMAQLSLEIYLYRIGNNFISRGSIIKGITIGDAIKNRIIT